MSPNVKVQALHFLRLLLQMKRWKYLWCIFVFLALISNHYLFPIVDKWLGNIGRTYVEVDATQFLSKNLILMNTVQEKEKLGNIKYMLSLEKTSSSYAIFESCPDTEVCESRMFSVLYGRIDTSKFTNYIFSSRTSSPNQISPAVPSIHCQTDFGGELHCPYLGNLAAVSQHNTQKNYSFQEVKFFSLTSRLEGKKANSKGGETTLCATNENVEAVYSRTVMVQCMLIVCSVSFYYLVSMQACIADLKKEGFLQRLFQKGLSVQAYWLVIGFVTFAEMVTFVMIYIVSLAAQCPNFFNPIHMIAVFFMALFDLLFIALVGLLINVTFGDYFYVGLLTIVFAILSMLFILVNRLVLSTSIWVKFFLLFVYPPGHFGEFVQGVMLSEIRIESIGFYNVTILFFTLLMLVIICFAIFFFDYTRPTGNGFCMPLNFLMNFSVIAEPEDEKNKDDPLLGEEPEPCANVEPVADGLQPLVRTSHLSKTYECKKIFQESTTIDAIKDMSVMFYENQITAIIGHNGSGKTTFLNLLIGVETPTTGQVSICGVLASCRLSRRRLTGKLGICPQVTDFDHSLTVEQTLRLTVASCGQEWEACKEEVNTILKMLSMNKKNDLVVGNMSYGQKRKLAVTMALLGNPMVVFLDEPTSGLDPESRHCMWKLLQSYRMRRCIIMSTQFMDEADTLADRKIFVSGGSLICAGSSLFLKSAFNCGFVFDVTLKNESQERLLRRQICNEFQSVKAKNSFGANIKFHLPANDVDHLPALAQSFEKRMDLISAFGLLQASLYDIFMQLKDLSPAAVEEIFNQDRAERAKQEENEKNLSDTQRLAQMNISMSKSIDGLGSAFKLTPSFFQQLRAFIVINITRLLRTRVRLVCRIIVPTCLLLMLSAMAVVERSSKNHDMYLRTNMTFANAGFEYGVCVYDEIKTRSFPLVDSYICSLIFCKGLARCPRSSMGAHRRYLALKKEATTSLANFLQLNDTIFRIERLCKSRISPTSICPIIYTPEWHDSANNMPYPNYKRRVYVGSYTIYEKLNSSVAALISIGVFNKAIHYFTRMFQGPAANESFFYTAESVYDWRSTVIPTLGAFFQTIIVSLLPATFLDDIIEDKATNVRSQLKSIGMDCLSYWLTNFIIHWLQYAIVYLLTAFLLVGIVQIGYNSMFYMVGVLLPTLFFGLPSNQLMVYVLSTIMNRSNYLITILYFFFSTLVSTMIILVQLNNVISVILIAMVPPYAVVALTFYSVKTLFYTLAYHKKLHLSEIPTLPNNFFFSQPHVVASFVAIILHVLILLTVLVLVENRLVLQQRLESYLSQNSTSNYEESYEDIGVQDMIKSISENPRNPDNLMEVRVISKTYPNNIKVVREITFSSGPMEIFGLLGPNGAGKSTALSMIVGQLETSSGRCEVYSNNAWLPSGLAASRGLIGYCPQYNSLYDCITPLEHLRFYASIIGVPPAAQETYLTALAEVINLEIETGQLAGQLSVGNRRRLSLAISLLGQPTVIVIDEASTGVDPEGKRFIWQAIRKAATVNSTMIFTTHSMEEVEALCTKVMVINRGLMVGLGTVQELRTRYGHSYSLEILIKTAIGENPDHTQIKREKLISAVQDKFAKSSVMEEFHDRVQFTIPTASITRLSQALSWLVGNQKGLFILYFSLHQMSMDQVFARMIKLHEKKLKLERRASIYSLSLDDAHDDPSRLSVVM